MWLDRISSQTTPSGSASPNRSYSPAPPRKSSYLAPNRNGINLAASRSTSSLDLSLNSSNISLPQTNRVPNGSALRHEQKPPEDIQDPLAVLAIVLGKDTTDRQSTKTAADKDHHIVSDVDFLGLSLEEFVAEPQESSKSSTAPQASITDARESRLRYKNFHTSITECDDTLASVESYLANFKAELGQVSAVIYNLQARSTQLNAQLENRRKVEKLLGPAVEELSVSPAIVKSIADGPIDDNFGKALTEIEARHLSIKARQKDAESNRVVEDILPLLEDLKTRAIERIRDYLVTQIKSLRSPNTNAQIIQQQTFLRHKELYPFLTRNHPILAEEIGQAYANTMRWYLSSNFQRYRSALDRLQLHPSNDSDLLGSDPAAARRNMLGGARGNQPQHDPFGLGKRADILKAKSDSALPAHLAEEGKGIYHMETPFRNYNQAMVDNACAEYFAATELFSTNTYHQVSRKVNEILDPTFSLGHELTKSLIDVSTDCFGILICVRLNQRLAFEAQKRKVPILDSYINYTNILLWPRFQKVMDLHCDSLKKVPVSVNRGAAAAFSLVVGNDTSKASMAPHPITQRFGQFTHGILTLSSDAGDDEPVAHSLTRLRSEYESLMGKLAKSAGDVTKRGRFLYNNYSLVLTIIGDTQGKLAEEQKEHFSMLIRDFKPR